MATTTGSSRAPWWVAWAVAAVCVWQPAIPMAAARMTADAARYFAAELKEEAEKHNESPPTTVAP